MIAAAAFLAAPPEGNPIREPGAGTSAQVERCEPHRTGAPDDPLFGEQQALAGIGLPEAWSLGAGRGEGVRVAVVDSGVDARHPDLSGKVVAARNFSGTGPATEDPTGHGTAVAGVLAAKADNGRGSAGVCPGCELVVARVDAYGAAGEAGTIQLARAIRWSVGRGARVVNVSLGTPAPSPRLREAVRHAGERGSLVVAAAGGQDDPPLYPAAYAEVVAVSAGRGAARPSPGEVSAPGRLVSTFPGGDYRPFSGTSAAAPQVSGTAALLVGEGLSAKEARERLVRTARGGGGREAPLLDAEAAVRSGGGGECRDGDGRGALG